MGEKVLIFEYRNWKGDIGIRAVKKPIEIWYGSTQYHPTEQWLMKAYDMDKEAERDFAMCDIRRFIEV